MLTQSDALTQARTAFKKHIPDGGLVESKNASFKEKEKCFDIDVEVRYRDGSSKMGTVSLSEDGGYAVCIMAEHTPQAGHTYPHSWHHGFLLDPLHA